MSLIVLQSHPVWLGNTMTWLHTQVSSLPPEIESHVVCRRTENLDQFAVPNIHSEEALPAWRRGIERGLARLRIRRYPALLPAVARREGARVLHSHFGNVGWANLGAARAARIPHVVSFYGRDVSMLPRSRPVWRKRYRRLFAEADAVLAMGTFMARCLTEIGCPDEKLRIHHLGVRLDALPFRPRTWDARADGPLRVLIAAMFREKKGVPHGIAALGIAARAVPLEVTVIGDATATAGDQEEKRKVLAAVSASGLEERVRFLGVQPYEVFIAESYRHHVFLSPSVTARDGDTEGGVALPVIEMAATGMPMVATIHADTPGVIEDGVSGLLAPERDDAALARHLISLAEHPAQWGPMVAAARRRVETGFDAAVQGIRLAAIYGELAGRPLSRGSARGRP